MTGQIVGGTEFIVAAYAVVWGGLLAYGVTLALRLRRAEKEKR